MPIELKKMSLAELRCVQAEVEELIKQYENARFNKLVSTLTETAKTMLKEFPDARTYIVADCPECGWEHRANVIQELADMSFDDFRY